MIFVPATIASKCGVTEDHSGQMEKYKYLVSGVFTIITVVVGTVGNILSIIILLNRL